MRKLFAFLLLAGFLIMSYPNKVVLIAKSFLLDEPTTHLVERNDWLSKMALKYYGDASYWKELALINRAPDPNMILPGEKIFIPAFDAIRQVRNARTISSVQNLIEQQELALRQAESGADERVAEIASKPEPIATQPAPENEHSQATNGYQDEATAAEEVPPAGIIETAPSPSESVAEGFSWPWMAGAALVVIGLIGFVLFRRKRTQQDDEVVETDRKPKSAETKTREDDDIFRVPPSRNHRSRQDADDSRKPKKDAELIHG